MPETNAYEIAVHQEEAGELANELLQTLVEKRVPGARLGTGLAALAIAMNRLVERLPIEARWKTREVMIGFILDRVTE